MEKTNTFAFADQFETMSKDEMSKICGGLAFDPILSKHQIDVVNNFLRGFTETYNLQNLLHDISGHHL